MATGDKTARVAAARRRGTAWHPCARNRRRSAGKAEKRCCFPARRSGSRPSPRGAREQVRRARKCARLLLHRHLWTTQELWGCHTGPSRYLWTSTHVQQNLHADLNFGKILAEPFAECCVISRIQSTSSSRVPSPHSRPASAPGGTSYVFRKRLPHARRLGASFFESSRTHDVLKTRSSYRGPRRSSRATVALRRHSSSNLGAKT